MAVTLQRGNA